MPTPISVYRAAINAVVSRFDPSCANISVEALRSQTNRDPEDATSIKSVMGEADDLAALPKTIA